MRLADIIAALKETYTRTLGTEYMYITDTATKRFFQDRLEPTRSRPAYTPEQRRHILERLTAAETAAAADLEPAGWAMRDLTVKGREQPVPVWSQSVGTA